jgi:hypothetical protein
MIPESMFSEIEQLAIKAGLIVEDEDQPGITYFCDGNVVQNLESFAQLAIQAHKEKG